MPQSTVTSSPTPRPASRSTAPVGEPVALVEAAGQLPDGIRAERAQRAQQHRRGADAVHVVVAEDGDRPSRARRGRGSAHRRRARPAACAGSCDSSAARKRRASSTLAEAAPREDRPHDRRYPEPLAQARARPRPHRGPTSTATASTASEGSSNARRTECTLCEVVDPSTADRVTGSAGEAAISCHEPRVQPFRQCEVCGVVRRQLMAKLPDAISKQPVWIPDQWHNREVVDCLERPTLSEQAPEHQTAQGVQRLRLYDLRRVDQPFPVCQRSPSRSPHVSLEGRRGTRSTQRRRSRSPLVALLADQAAATRGPVYGSRRATRLLNSDQVGRRAISVSRASRNSFSD